MKTALVLAAIVGITLGQGYYHQEYNYKTSSSSYKNNELQHKTDDQGYYSKDGDLEGRVRPKVKANSEHSEYVNPNSGSRGSSGYYDANTDLTSHGNLLANTYGASVGGELSSGYQTGSAHYGNALESEGLASSNYIGGYSGSTYNAHSGGSFQSANLRSVGSRLQNDLQQELQAAIRESHLTDISVLEEELRRNLTSRLNDILRERYGTQTIKGGLSYSLTDGRLQASPNYEQNELEQLQRQIEQSLLDKLRQQYNYRTSHQSYNQQHYERYESTTTLRPYTYKPIYPDLNVIPAEVNYQGYRGTKDSQYHYVSGSHQQVASNTEYVQAPSAVSITTIASNVQRDLNNRLNQILEDAQRQYFSESQRLGTLNTAPILERLRQDLRQNLTYTFEEELRRHFGTQFERNGYMFSNGQSNQYNYNVADLENLRRQVEDNLITKLNRDFEAARQHWVTRQQQQQRSSQTQQIIYGQSNEYNRPSESNQRYVYSTPRYVDDYYRPTAASIVPLIGSGIKGGLRYQDGSSHINAYQSSESSNMIQLQNQLQRELSNQLKAALTQNRAHIGQYSTDTSQTAFNEAYNRLYEELQRNLTSQLQSFMAGSSGYTSSQGSFSNNQLAELRSQLQNNLASQLQQGLQQSYSASASYSASSGSSATAGSGAYSSSNSGGYYRAARESENRQFAQYSAGGGYQMEDCQGQGEDPYQHQYHRMKRSYGYRSRPLGLATNTGAAYGARGSGYGSSNYGGGYIQTGQQVDDSELSQPSYGFQASSNYGNHQVGQQIDDTDETQQVEIIDPVLDDVRAQQSFPAFSNVETPVGQEVDDSDTQQVEINPHMDWVGQVEDNSDDTQYVENGFQQVTSTTPKSYGYSRPSSVYQSVGQPTGGYNYHHSQTSSGGNQYYAPDKNVQYLENSGNVETSTESQGRQTPSSQYSTNVGKNLQNTGRPLGQIPKLQTGLTANPSGDVSSQRVQVPLGGNQHFTDEQKIQYLENSHTQLSRDDVLHSYGNQEIQSSVGAGQYFRPDVQHSETNRGTVSQVPNSHNRETGQVVDDSETVQFQVGGFVKPNAGQVVDDSEITQQTEDEAFAPLETGNQLKPAAEDKREALVTDKPSRHRSHPKLPSADQTDRDDTQQVELPVNNNGYETYYNIGEPTYLRPDGTPENGRTKPLENSIEPVTEQTRDDFNTLQPIAPIFRQTERPSTTTLNPSLILSYGTQKNVLSESENLPKLFDTTQFSTTPVSTNFIQQTPYEGVPNNKFPQFGSTVVNIPSQLKPLSVQIEANLLQNLEETLVSEVTSPNNPSQLYQQTLYTLKANISRECQKLLSETQFLNVQQKDVIQLQTYLEYSLVQRLNQKFVFATSGEVVAFKPQLAQPALVNSYRPNLPVNSNTFIQMETQYPRLYTQYNLRPLVPESIATPRTQTQQTPSENPSNGLLPLPAFKPAYSQVEREADLLLENLRNSLQSRSTTPRPSQQPEYQVIQVKLENITPEQFSIINQIEQEFSSVVDTAIQSEFASKSFDHSSRYALYQSSLNKLEQELKRNLTECIEGTLNQGSELQYLNKYSSQVYANFDYQKINDVKKYIEIKLIKKLRAQLKTLYNLDNSVSSQSGIVSGVVQQTSHVTPTNVVRLENLTPEQARVIKSIEDDINKQVKEAIERHITSLRDRDVSDYVFKSSLETLEEELKNNITSSIQSLCEPGFGQYPELQASHFDMGKINDLEKYLQIRLVGKLRETIKYYSRTVSSSNTLYHSSSSHNYRHNYNSYQQSSHRYETVPDHRDVELLEPGTPAVPVIPLVQPPSPGSVKGGRPQSPYREVNPYVLGANPNAVRDETLSSSTVDPEVTEPVTEAQSWWNKFGNKIKQGANKLRDKITGKYTEPTSE